MKIQYIAGRHVGIGIGSETVNVIVTRSGAFVIRRGPGESLTRSELVNLGFYSVDHPDRYYQTEPPFKIEESAVTKWIDQLGGKMIVPDPDRNRDLIEQLARQGVIKLT